jgi:hypothetical protein
MRNFLPILSLEHNQAKYLLHLVDNIGYYRHNTILWYLTYRQEFIR